MRLSDYELYEMIGKGGQGEVFNAKRKSDGLSVVIKKVIKTNSRSRNKIPTEIKLLKRVQNIEGVIKMLDFIIEEDFYYIVMEKIDVCEDLYQLLDNTDTLSEPFIKKMFSAIVKTVIKCRESGVFHRDIKDENILVDLKTNNIKLIDFGVACEYDYKKETDKMFEAKDFRGTPMITPPECYNHEKYQEESMTVWSLGFLLYSMLHKGQLPYNSVKEICFGILDWKKSKLSDEVQDLINQCLIKEQKKRIRLNSILSHTWFTQCKY